MSQIDIFDEIIVDNFAGGGGASTGIELAASRPVAIAINHDPDAILLHKTNHPYTEHLQASVWDVDPVEVCKGRPVGLAWFSPDCKHFSKAKGAALRDRNIRGLAWIVLRWAGTVRPFYPGGDYERFEYPTGCVVLDNPPFSILTKICEFYLEREIPFFLFAPSLTAFAGRNVVMRTCHIISDSDIVYENGAVVHTAFITSFGGDVIARTAPELRRLIDRAVAKIKAETKREIPKYTYPWHILTAAMLQKYSKYGIEWEVRREDCMPIGTMDAQRESKKSIFGGDSWRFDTGVHVQIPEGYAGVLKSKSGLNVQYGVQSDGLIDSGYTGAIVVKLYNHGKAAVRIEAGQKISQLVIVPIVTPDLIQVDSLEDTERGNSGFGSSGKF